MPTVLWFGRVVLKDALHATFPKPEADRRRLTEPSMIRVESYKKSYGETIAADLSLTSAGPGIVGPNGGKATTCGLAVIRRPGSPVNRGAAVTIRLQPKVSWHSFPMSQLFDVLTVWDLEFTAWSTE